MTMKNNEVKAFVKNSVRTSLDGILSELGAVPFGDDFHVAIPVQVDGITVYVKVEMTCANWYDTKTSKAFDPSALHEAYLEERRIAEAKKEEKARKKAEKLAK